MLEFIYTPQNIASKILFPKHSTYIEYCIGAL